MNRSALLTKISLTMLLSLSSSISFTAEAGWPNKKRRVTHLLSLHASQRDQAKLALYLTGNLPGRLPVSSDSKSTTKWTTPVHLVAKYGWPVIPNQIKLNNTLEKGGHVPLAYGVTL